MAHIDNTTISYRCLQYNGEEINCLDGNNVIRFTSERQHYRGGCPICGGRVEGHGQTVVKLKDVPLIPCEPVTFEVHQHRYICKECRHTFREDNPLKAPGFHVTRRCILWIFKMLQLKVPTSMIAEFLGLNWNTVRKVEKIRLDDILTKQEQKRLKSSYRPYYLAVDEFAIRKGHRYATCVMDLVTGEILWVGKGRSIHDFTAFFEAYANTDYLSKVKAVAMDMNASYYTLVKQHLPSAAIVYDRYHVQAQFGRDVLGQVRLSEAREHQKKAKELTRQISLKDKDDTLDLKQEIRNEKRQYNQVKKARWIILMNKNFLSASKQASLNEILESHSDLAICYAMKEELLRLFELKDHTEAEQGWKKWFDAAINSSVPAPAKFGRQKLKRLDGLVAHASFPINTGKLEGFYNKIKVAKRNAYGFRNLSYFFFYVKYLSIPKIFS